MYAYKHIYIYDLCIHLMYLKIYHLEYTIYIYSYIYLYAHNIRKKSIKLRPQEIPPKSFNVQHQISPQSSNFRYNPPENTKKKKTSQKFFEI